MIASLQWVQASPGSRPPPCPPTCLPTCSPAHLPACSHRGYGQSHISAFNGDPNNVTISGQSNGGTICWQLLASPLAEGLFHKAVVLSGPANNTAPQADHEALAADLLAAEKITTQDGLNSLDNDDILRLTAKFQDLSMKSAEGKYGFLSDTVKQPFQGSWDADDDALPQDVFAALSSGRSRTIPILLGTCLEDGDLSKIMPLPAGMAAGLFLSMFPGLTGAPLTQWSAVVCHADRTLPR